MSVLQNIINGTFLQRITGKNLLFIATIVFLFLVYIAMRYNCYSIVNDINTLDRDINNLKSKSFGVKSKHQNIISMHELDAKLSVIGVGISKEPVKDIIIIK